MKKVLIIHPKDQSTEFLRKIYENLNTENIIICNDPNYPSSKIRSLIKNSDIVILLGHGTEWGLLSDSFGERFSRLIIDSKNVDELRKKDLVIGVWCNANIFFEKYDINGFATGMFISEKEEACDYNISCSQEEINKACELFSDLLSNEIKDIIELKNLPDIFKNLEENYKGNDVIDFNRSGFFINLKTSTSLNNDNINLNDYEKRKFEEN